MKGQQGLWCKHEGVWKEGILPWVVGICWVFFLGACNLSGVVVVVLSTYIISLVVVLSIHSFRHPSRCFKISTIPPPFLVIKEDPNTTSSIPLSTTHPIPTYTPTQLVAWNYSFFGNCSTDRRLYH